MTQKKSKYVPTKNYILAGLLLIGVILLFLYAFQWKNVIDEETYLESYLVKSNTISLQVQTLEELESLMLEQMGTYFIYTGYTADKNIYELEEDLEPVINEYNLNDLFVYLDVTSLKDNDDFLTKLSDTVGVEITNIPSIIYIDDQEPVEVIDKGESTFLRAGELEKLLENYEFEKSN